MAIAGVSQELTGAVALLGAAVVMVPPFRRLGLGSVLGYLAAGLLVGPSCLRWFVDPQAILHVAELGVVLLLFLIGLEMRPTHLWNLRRDIFLVGGVQILACTAVLTAVGVSFGFPPVVSFIGGMGFVLTSTAIVMQMLTERGDVAQPRGQRIVAVLLFEDLLIVPLLVLVAFLSPERVADAGESRWLGPLIGLGAVAAVLAIGLWLLNPLLRLLAATRTREVMAAAALFVVLGAALLMQLGGLSMAMGAFLAGVLLSESSFRHQIEADVEPFRGILLGLFFVGVGMSLDLAVVVQHWPLIVSGVLALMFAKAVAVYVVARALRSGHDEALDRAVLMAQGGEFAFVLYAASEQAGLIETTVHTNLTAIVVFSMLLTPVAVAIARRLRRAARPDMDGIDAPEGLSGSVLLIGFGRFGQVASQSLLARNVDVTIIDTDVEMIRAASEFGFKIYFGDGARLDVLRASGAGSARAIAICVDDREAANRIVELAREEFPQAKLLVRSFDREHSLQLVSMGVDVQVRETFESAVRFGECALLALDVDAADAAEVSADVRRRDRQRFEFEQAGGLYAGVHLMRGNAPRPLPLLTPQRESRALSPETEAAAREDGAPG